MIDTLHICIVSDYHKREPITVIYIYRILESWILFKNVLISGSNVLFTFLS